MRLNIRKIALHLKSGGALRICWGPRDTFDGEHLRAVVAERKGQTGINPPPVDDDGAGAALAAVAAFLCSGQIELLAQEIEQRDSRIIKRWCA
jgi:hypothetical protein